MENRQQAVGYRVCPSAERGPYKRLLCLCRYCSPIIGKLESRYLAEEPSLEEVAMRIEIGQYLACVIPGPCCEDVHVSQSVELIQEVVKVGPLVDSEDGVGLGLVIDGETLKVALLGLAPDSVYQSVI